MFAKQLSVFIENRQGRLGEVLDVLKKNDINILSLSLADTMEYGLLRLIVSDAKLGKEKLTNEGFSTLLSDVLILHIDHECGSLQKLVTILSEHNVSIEYMYGLSIDGSKASIVLKVSDAQLTEKILKEYKVEFLTDEDIKKL